MLIYADQMLPIYILIIVIGAFAAIALVAYIVHKILRPKFKDEEKKDEATLARENLDRILEDVEDEKTAEEIANYKDEDE